MTHSPEPEDILGLSPKEKRALLLKMLKQKAKTPNSLPVTMKEGMEILDQFSTSVVELQDEVYLDLDIPVDDVAFKLIYPPQNIFLTGATGFLGSFLLHELLQQTEANIYCLVRCADEEEGQQRIQNSLTSYGLDDHSDSNRIVPIPGDLAEPLLGMEPDQFDWIADTIDTIYHNGAYVNWIYPYERLKAANVHGTHEVIRLACTAAIKPVHYISTLSIFPIVGDTNDMVIREDDTIDHGGTLYGGYTQSKWVAEKIISLAQSQGLPVSIYRPGLITGHSQMGVGNVEDFTSKLIKSWTEVGFAPEIEATMDMTPVDYVSRAIVYLSLLPDALKTVFHLVNPHPMPLNNLVNWMCGAGYLEGSKPYDQWRGDLMKFAGQSLESAGYSLLPIFHLKRAEQASGLPKFDSHNTLTHLQNTTITCPPADAALLDRYFDYFVRSGFIKPPQLQEIARGAG